MKRITHYFTAGLVVAAVSLIAVACGSGSTSASDTLSSAQSAAVQALIQTATAPMQAQIDTLTSTLAADEATIKNLQDNQLALHLHGGGVSTAVAARTTNSVDACASGINLGTLTGISPTNDNRTADNLNGKSTTLYNYVISGAATSNDCGVIQPLPTIGPTGTMPIIYFDAPDCTGTPYVFYISSSAIAQGMVVRIDPTDADPDGTNTGTYYYLPAGSTPSAFNQLSRYDNGTCQTLPAPDPSSDYKLLPNDPAVTGIPNQPILGPITSTQS